MKEKDIQHIGIIGDSIGSSLLCLEAKKRGIKTTLLESNLQSDTSRFADEHLVTDARFSNIEKLALRVDAIVFGKNIYADFENDAIKDIKTYPSIKMMNLLKNKIGWLSLAKENGIPTPIYYYQDNRQEAFEEIENLPFPFNFYQYYADRFDVVEVTKPDEMGNFLFEIDENADSWLTLAKEDYDHVLSVTGIIDEALKVYLYEISNEEEGDDEIIMHMPAKITKTTSTKLIRYSKKLLKAFSEMGIYTLIYGIKKDKGIELIDVTVETDENQMATMHYHNIAVYEQLINMIKGQKVIPPKMYLPSVTCKIFSDDLPQFLKQHQEVYHLYDVIEEETIVIYPIES